MKTEVEVDNVEPHPNLPLGRWNLQCKWMELG